MSDKSSTAQQTDAEELSRTLVGISERSQELVSEFLARQQESRTINMDDATHMSGLFQQLTTRLMANPLQLAQAQMAFWQDYLKLVNTAALRFWGHQQDPVISPEATDKRFRHEAWEENPIFDFIKQAYLLTADYLQATANNVDGLDDKTSRKISFYTRQFVDALSPTNFVATNPEVLEKTLETKGHNLLKGLKNLLEDLSMVDGKLHIRMTDTEAFEVGKNLAVTPGKVVYQTDLMQLIQYTPSTPKVHKLPLLFVPPWINKYYILDLQPKNSLIKYMVDQGHTVFVVSWKNPTTEHADKAFDDYMLEGPLAALDAIEQATGERQVNAVGYCLGGTLMGATLAYMAAKGDDRIKSITFFTAMMDFHRPGELELFIDEEQLANLDRRMGEKGYLEGSAMAATMSSLRSNDLVWSFFISNYLHGNDPFPFDLLYWNQDCTNMPAKMHSFYLRNMYQENHLKDPGGITLNGVPIDLRKIETPSCFVSAVEDHIAPWKTCYRGVHLVSGNSRFILGGSGHIAGIINPPTRNKYGYWTNSRNPEDPDAWLDGATHKEGSWWPEWNRWLVKQAGPKVEARQPGEGKLSALEDAPGSYVVEKACV
ncbi:MAG: class I poly(R)-hydroxyalkanoic acid synthase [Aquisalimonadaceae bacterium]